MQEEGREEARERVKRTRPRGDASDPTDKLWSRIVQGGVWRYTGGGVRLVERNGEPAVHAATMVITDEERHRERWPEAKVHEADGAAVLDALFEILEPYRDDRARFVAEQADAVLRLVRRFGPLGLCQRHRIPLGHGHDAPDEDYPRCLLPVPEPVGWWWDEGRRALATADLIAAIRSRRSARQQYSEEWKIITGRSVGAIRELREAQRWNPRREIQSAVNFLLARAEPRPRIAWRREDDRARFDPFGSVGSPVLAAIAVQLALLACGVDALAFCHVCGRPYRPDRRPRTDRREFCGEGCRRRAAARRSAEWRSRRGA